MNDYSSYKYKNNNIKYYQNPEHASLEQPFTCAYFYTFCCSDWCVTMLHASAQLGRTVGCGYIIMGFELVLNMNTWRQ